MNFYKNRQQDAISIAIAELSPREVNKKEKKKWRFKIWYLMYDKKLYKGKRRKPGEDYQMSDE